MEPQAARREQDDGGERGRPGDTQPCRWQIAGGWRLERERERVSRLFTLRTEKMVMVGEAGADLAVGRTGLEPPLLL